MKKLSLSAAVLLLITTCLLLLSGCEDGSTEIDGMKVSDISVILVQNNHFDFKLSVKNPSSDDKVFDMSRFTLKLGDSEEIPLLAGKEDCPAKKKTEFAIMIDSDHPSMRVGDSVTVYYDDDKVCEIKIENL